MLGSLRYTENIHSSPSAKPQLNETSRCLNKTPVESCAVCHTHTMNSTTRLNKTDKRIPKSVM